jgi:thiazole synthase
VSDPFVLGGETFTSRLLLGTAGYPNREALLASLEAGAPELVTVAVRRVALDASGESLPSLLAPRYRLLPNTAGCFTARDAVLTAQLAREALGTSWVKLELIGDRETLYPDVVQLVQAADQLVRDGFIVLPYCTDDPVVCRRLADVGCAAVMPLASFIGSGRGVLNPAALEHLCARSDVPVIVDAGIGTASHATFAMELGASAVLANTAVARADQPVLMAAALRDAVRAGRAARLAGRIPERQFADPSSPEIGLIGS